MHSVAQDAQDRGVLCQVLLLMMVQPDLLLDHGKAVTSGKLIRGYIREQLRREKNF